MAATKFHFDGPKPLPLECARTLAGPGPRFAGIRSRRTGVSRRYASAPLKAPSGQQVHRKGRPFAHLGPDTDIPLLAGDNAVCQVKPQADPLLGSGLRRPVNPLEDVVVMFLGDAGAGVGDVDAGIKLPGPDGDQNPAGGGGVLDSVVEDVAQRLGRPFGVVADSDLRVTVGLQLDPLLL